MTETAPRNPSPDAAPDIDLWRERIRRDAFGRYHLEMGVAIHREGNLEAAAAALQRAIDTEPDLTDSYFHLARVLHTQGREAEADAALAAGRVRNPAFAAEALGRDALRHLGFGRVDEALATLDAVAAPGPIPAAVAFLRGVVFAEAGRVEDAAIIFAAADPLPSPPDGDELALDVAPLLVSLSLKAEGEEALTFARRALRLDRGSLAALRRLADLLARAEVWDEVEGVVTAGLGVDPYDPVLLGLRGLLLNRQGRPVEAEPVLRTALDGESEPSSWILGQLGAALNAVGRYRDALPILEQATALASEDETPQGLLAEARRNLNLPASGDLARALNRHPLSGWLAGQLALALAAEGQPERAMTAFRRGLALLPEAGWMLVELGVLLARHGQGPAAVTALIRATAAAPESPVFAEALGLVLATLGHREAAETMLRRVVKGNPSVRAARWTLAGLRLAADGDGSGGGSGTAEAAVLLQGAESAPDPLAVLTSLGRALPGPAVVPALRRLCAHGPAAGPSLWLGLGLLAAGHDVAEAAALLSTAESALPGSPAAPALVGLALLHADDTAAALAAMERAVAADGSDGTWRTYRGLALQAAGQPDAAAADHRAALDKAPLHVAALLHQAALLAATGDTAQARYLVVGAFSRQEPRVALHVRVLPAFARALVEPLLPR